MRLNIIIIISCLFIGLGSCNSSKNTKKAKPDAVTATVDNTVEKVKETMTEAKTEVVKKEETVETKVKDVVKETKEVVKPKMEKAENKDTPAAPTKQMNTKIKEAVKETKEVVQQMEKTESKTTTNAPEKQINTEEIDAGKTKAEASKKMQEQQANLVGKYKWLKRVCCGRMQKTTLPEAGEETFMTFTEDGKVLYSGTALKNAENCEYTLDMNFRSFPERPMLKMGKKIAALMHFYGDTLCIDRGYIDLDKNYWLKIE